MIDHLSCFALPYLAVLRLSSITGTDPCLHFQTTYRRWSERTNAKTQGLSFETVSANPNTTLQQMNTPPTNNLGGSGYRFYTVLAESPGILPILCGNTSSGSFSFLAFFQIFHMGFEGENSIKHKSREIDLPFYFQHQCYRYFGQLSSIPQTLWNYSLVVNNSLWVIPCLLSRILTSD